MVRFPTPCPLRASSRGALFGLDARIALVIFMAIAIIAGYSTIKQVATTKDTALLRELQAVDHALQAYQTDMRTFPEFSIDGGSDGAKDFAALWDKTNVAANFQKDWNGPYITLRSRTHTLYGDYSLIYKQADVTQNCISSSDCYVWIVLSNVPTKTWETLNRYVDESSGSSSEAAGTEHTSGTVRADAATDPRTLYYRSIARVK